MKGLLYELMALWITMLSLVLIVLAFNVRAHYVCQDTCSPYAVYSCSMLEAACLTDDSKVLERKSFSGENQ